MLIFNHVDYFRFTGASVEDSAASAKRTLESTNPFEEPAGPNPFEPQAEVATQSVNVFHGLISRCFENHLNIFVDSQDK